MLPPSLLLRLTFAAAVLGAFAYTDVKSYHAGENSVQVEFDKYKAAQVQAAIAEQTARAAKEQALNQANQKVTDDYESLKAATATAVGALTADRVRLQATITAARRAASQNPTPGPSPDVTPEDGVLGECVQRREEVAADAAALSDQLTALQSWVNTVVPE